MSKIIVAVLRIFTAPAGMSQAQMQGGDLAKVQTEWMKANLDLTQEQLKEVAEINKTFANDVQQIVYAKDGEKDARLQKLNQTIQDKHDELKEILDEKQFAAFAEQDKVWNSGLRSKIS